MGLGRYASLAGTFSGILRGRSYYHVAQPVGRHFDPGSLRGYFNDLSAKAGWPGARDAEGIPLIGLSNGERIYFPITIAQMALGNFERWLDSGKTDDRSKGEFLRLAAWFTRNQDDRGGWDNHWRHLRPSAVSGYSGMAQGQAMSVLVRAYALTENDAFLRGARRAAGLLLAPVGSGGCSYLDADRLYLEEFPEVPRSTVLNGWIFASFGLHDLALTTRDAEIRSAHRRTVDTIRESLESYDAGYWSYYDVRGRIASPFYHTLHIAQLESLRLLTGDVAFQNRIDRWRSYEARGLNRGRALAAKLWQKLRTAERVTLVDETVRHG